MTDQNVTQPMGGSLLTNHVTWTGEGTQRVYVLTHDSIEVFLHQKRAALSAGAMLLGWLGILVTIVLTLNTATFRDTPWADSSEIKAIFVLTAIACGIMAAREFWRWLKAENSPEKMAEELGRRGIKPAGLVA